MEEKAKENLYLIVLRKKLVTSTIKNTTISINNNLNSARRRLKFLMTSRILK
jgi:hypothetical protein